MTGNFLYFRMHRIVDIYFVGGFGTVQWIDPLEYTSCQPDTVVLNDPHTTLQVSTAPAPHCKKLAACCEPHVLL